VDCSDIDDFDIFILILIVFIEKGIFLMIPDFIVATFLRARMWVF